jgi:EAL domain-containing protein (putative c-di-GMP-specific phosphodiesterase class I)
MERLNERMLRASFCALKDWDQQGFNIPHVSVNFASDDLRNPKLVERIEWELDRQDLSADRLCVEVLETVMAGSGDDIIHRNLARLSDIGCLLDLDDFGTGHASIAAIRRFGIDRLKIDRSFITKLIARQHKVKWFGQLYPWRMSSGIEALAEGVETLSEHAKLAQIGCHHVQGFGLAKPMPFGGNPCMDSRPQDQSNKRTVADTAVCLKRCASNLSYCRSQVRKSPFPLTFGPHKGSTAPLDLETGGRQWTSKIEI